MENQNPYTYTLALILAFCCSLAILAKIFRSKTTRIPPPSPPALPIIGHLHLIKQPLFKEATSLSTKYGPVFSLRFGRRNFLFVSSPAAVEECFTKNDGVIANRPQTLGYDRLSYDYSAFAVAPYGHLWRVLRRHAVAESLSVNRLQSSSVVREEEIQKVIRSIHRCGARRVDLSYWISVYTFNGLNRIITGKPLIREEDVWVGGEMAAKMLIHESRSILASIPTWSLCDYFPVLRFIGFRGIEKGYVSWHEKRDALLQDLVDECRKSGMQQQQKNKRSYIETLLSDQELEPDFFSDDRIKSQLLVMFAAGRDTSTLVIERTMSLLMNHPDAMLKLRNEIDSLVGHTRLVKESDIPNLGYLRCVVDESMRMYPIAPLLGPRCASQDVTISGYHVPQGTVILANAWALHRDPELWERAEDFVPERFEEREEGLSFKFLPFGTGRRACPGTNLGIRNVSLAVGALVQCFDWDNVWDENANTLEAFCSPRQETLGLLSQL